MRMLLLYVLLTAAPSWAEWTLVDGKGTTEEDLNVYVDLSTIKRSGSVVTMLDLFDDIAESKSMKSMAAYDCQAWVARRIYASFHSGHMGQGRLTMELDEQNAWSSIVPGS